MKTNKTFRDLYKSPGFRARATLRPHPEDPDGYIVTLDRRQKKLFVPVAGAQYPVIETGVFIWFETWMPDQATSTLSLSIAGLPVHIVKP
jgi:hypothetical protein